MRKVPFFLGLVLLIFPLNWARLAILRQIPAGTDPRQVFLVSTIVVLISALLIWFGLPAVRESYRAVPEGPGDPPGLLARLGAAIRDAHQRSIQRKLEERRRREEELEQARSGRLTPIDPGPVILQTGEDAFASIPASLLELRTVRYRGRSTGVSVRVAKGVWLRESGSRGTPEKGLVPVAHGCLVITNRRFVFAGDQKTMQLRLRRFLLSRR